MKFKFSLIYIIAYYAPIESLLIPNTASSLAISRIEDLYGKSQLDIWLIINSLAYENAELENTISQLNGSILRNNSEERNILAGVHTDVTLISDVERLHYSNKALSNQIQKLGNFFEKIVYEDSAHDLGCQADLAALQQVFPDAIKKPYSIRSLADLVEFIKNPDTAAMESICSPEAVSAWSAKEEHEKKVIKDKLNDLLGKFPKLIFSIELLKNY